MCKICHSENQVRNLNLYVNGSEGIDLCQECQMRIIKYIRELQNLASIARKHGYLKAKNNIPFSENVSLLETLKRRYP